LNDSKILVLRNLLEETLSGVTIRRARVDIQININMKERSTRAVIQVMGTRPIRREGGLRADTSIVVTFEDYEVC
jgi:hypothetical protein